MNYSKDNLGHRSRVRKKFISSLGEELHDYELLEILLFAANSRQDTKSLAKKLINKFGDISTVINADIDRLKDIEGVGEAAIVQIKLVANIIKRVLKKSSQEKKILNNWSALLDYAFASLRYLNHEVFRVLFLDKKHQLLEDELLQEGESDFVFVSSKIIAKKALLLSASSIVLMHNHPTGELKASLSDIKATNEVIFTLKGLGIEVLDHIIVSSKGCFSFKEEGLL